MLRGEQKRQEQQDNQLLYDNLINSLKTKNTKANYIRGLRYFLEFLGDKTGKNYSLLLDPSKDRKMFEADIKSFLVHLRQKKKVSYDSAAQYLYAIRKFYYVNSDYEFKWALIRQYLGNEDESSSIENEDQQQEEEDRPYTRQEIHTMLKTANDIRVKIMILLIASSGMRLGAIPLLKIRNFAKNEELGIYQISVYEGSRKSNYKTFCTPECTSLIDSYLDYRKHSGEVLKGSSPLIREQFDASDMFKVSNPRHIGTGLVKYSVNEVLVKYSGLKQKLEYDFENKKKIGKKHPTMLTHALRKFFDTECRKAGVYPDFVELLMGHKLPGVKSHYFKPDINTLLQGTKECKGYVAAINDLTINEEFRLTKKVQELNEKNEYQNYVIDKKLKSLEDFVLQMFENYEKVDMIESQKLSKKIKEANDKGECYAIYPSDKEVSTEKEILEKEMKDDVYKRWALMLLNRPDLQKKYNVKMSFKDKDK